MPCRKSGNLLESTDSMRGLSILTGLCLGLCSCGSSQPIDVSDPGAETAKKDGSAKGADSSQLSIDLGKITPKVPPGVNPFPASSFVSYLGLSHGASKSQVTSLLPKKHADLGARAAINLVGSTGFEYSGHMAISWETESGRVDYMSVRSATAKRFLEQQNRSDTKLDALWRASPSAAWGILGKPTERVSRPHLEAFIYKFKAADARAGTLTLKFSKLSDPPRCQSVSVAWDY